MRRFVTIAVAGVAALAFTASAQAAATVVKPGGHFNVGPVYVKSVSAGGVKLARACNATGTVCRYVKTRPRSACAFACPVLAAWQTWRGGQNGRIVVSRSSRYPVRITWERLPDCGCS